jgi:hypothetical protein
MGYLPVVRNAVWFMIGLWCLTSLSTLFQKPGTKMLVIDAGGMYTTVEQKVDTYAFR